jgi:uncharacterized protein YkwD
VCARRASFHARQPGSRPVHARGCARRRAGSRGTNPRHRRRVRQPRPHLRKGHRQAAEGGSCAGATLTPTPNDVERVRSATLCLVNRERALHGEDALQANAHLEQAAQAHSESMASSDYFDHVGPSGDTPLSRMRAAGYIYSSKIGFEVGENIGWGTLWESTPRAIVAAWMASPGHRANILDAHYRDTAIGVAAHPPSSFAHGQPGGMYTQDFGVIIVA